MILRHPPRPIVDILPSRIRFIGTPPGDPQNSAPHIRDAWIGIEVPTIGTIAPTVLGPGALVGSIKNNGGYLVPIKPAISALTSAGNDEVAWWMIRWVAKVKKAGHDITLGDYLVFDRNVCRAVR